MAKKSLQLGRAVNWPDSPAKATLDRVPNPQAGTDYLVRFTAPARRAFVTNQPAVDLFPLATWAQLLGRRARRARVHDLIGGEAFPQAKYSGGRVVAEERYRRSPRQEIPSFALEMAPS